MTQSNLPRLVALTTPIPGDSGEVGAAGLSPSSMVHSKISPDCWLLTTSTPGHSCEVRPVVLSPTKTHMHKKKPRPAPSICMHMRGDRPTPSPSCACLWALPGGIHPNCSEEAKPYLSIIHLPITLFACLQGSCMHRVLGHDTWMNEGSNRAACLVARTLNAQEAGS
jgi:hypothetical protein